MFLSTGRKVLIALVVIGTLAACEGSPSIGTQAGNCRRLMSLVDDLQAGSGLTNEQIDSRLENIYFDEDWGVLGESYARLEGYLADGDQVGAADETLHLYDQCTRYLANR